MSRVLLKVVSGFLLAFVVGEECDFALIVIGYINAQGVNIYD